MNSTCTRLRNRRAVAMLDGVDDRLANGDADPVNRIVVESDRARDVSLTICTKSSIASELWKSIRTVLPLVIGPKAEL